MGTIICSKIIFLIVTIYNSIQCIEDLEFMENTGATIINQTDNEETNLLQELLGKPVGDVTSATAVSNGKSKRSKIKINCHHMPPGTSNKRKSLLMKLCPTLRDKMYNKHANNVAKILKNQYTSSKSLDDQKKDFMNAVTEMARAAGHYPTLEFH